MFEAKDILPLIGIPETKIQFINTVYDDNEAIVRIELADIRGHCPKCGSTSMALKTIMRFTLTTPLSNTKRLLS